MIQRTRAKYFAGWMTALLLSVCVIFSINVFGDEGPLAPMMPPHWKVISDIQIPAEQLKAISTNLGADLSSVRNTVYDVHGMRVQINTIITSDVRNAEKLMKKLRSMKAEEALLQKDLTVYEFVGQNDALPLIEEGRKHLDSR